MMVMTAKVNLKKWVFILGAAAAAILAVILLLGGEGNAPAAATGAKASTVSGNDSRIQFLKDFGWEISASPAESSQVRIPQETSDVFNRYNTLQKGQGYDLSTYAGKNVMRYVYEVNNYPGATQPVYATLLVHKNQVIGGDVTDTSPGGKIRGFKMPETAATAPSTSAPTASAPTAAAGQ